MQLEWCNLKNKLQGFDWKFKIMIILAIQKINNSAGTYF